MNITIQDALISLDYIKHFLIKDYEDGNVDVEKFARFYVFYTDTEILLKKMLNDAEIGMKELRGENHEIS